MEFYVQTLMFGENDITDGRLDTAKVLRSNYKEWLKGLSPKQVVEQMSNSKDFVTVYHGTSTFYLPQVFEKGIESRLMGGRNSNWQGEYDGIELESFKELVYITNTMHYYYANMADKKVESNTFHFPCYFKLKVPASVLVPDEDAFHSRLAMSRFYQHHTSKGEIPFWFTGEESLENYYTSAVPYIIPHEFIEEITILGDKEFVEDYIVRPSSSYRKAINTWSNSGGDTDFDLKRLQKKEKSSKKNKTFNITDVDGINNFIKKLK